MYLDKIIWLLAWPIIIAVAYYLSVFLLKKLDNQVKEDPIYKDKQP